MAMSGLSVSRETITYFVRNFDDRKKSSLWRLFYLRSLLMPGDKKCDIITERNQKHEVTGWAISIREIDDEKGKIEIVREMLRTHQPLEFISEMTKFLSEKIAEIGKLHGLL